MIDLKFPDGAVRQYPAGSTARDVAKLLQIPVGTAKSRLRRARADCARRAAAHTVARWGSAP